MARPVPCNFTGVFSNYQDLGMQAERGRLDVGVSVVVLHVAWRTKRAAGAGCDAGAPTPARAPTRVSLTVRGETPQQHRGFPHEYPIIHVYRVNPMLAMLHALSRLVQVQLCTQDRTNLEGRAGVNAFVRRRQLHRRAVS